eukprot:6182094-Pleurochrysis_carterae.AAC.5
MCARSRFAKRAGCSKGIASGYARLSRSCEARPIELQGGKIARARVSPRARCARKCSLVSAHRV